MSNFCFLKHNQDEKKYIFCVFCFKHKLFRLVSKCARNILFFNGNKNHESNLFFENKTKIWISVTWVDNMRAMFFHEKVLKVS